MLGRRHALPEPSVDDAWREWARRKARCVRMGYADEVAARVAWSGWDLDDLESRIADLQRQGCPPEWAREIAW